MAVEQTHLFTRRAKILRGVKFWIGVPHRFGFALANHNLEKYRLDAIVLIAVNDAGRAGNAIPRAQIDLEAPPVFLLEKDHQSSS